MSPWNSYFKHKEIAHLLRETIKKYDKAIIMIADIPAIATYEAMGYHIAKAQTKARLQGNNLKNKTQQTLDAIGIDSSKVVIIDRAEEVENNEIYKKELEKIENLFTNNQNFHTSVLQTSEEVLKNSKKDYTTKDAEHATHYLLSEMAFIEFASQYFNAEKILYTYHKPRRVYEDYIAGVFDGIIKYHLDFVLLEAPYETFLSIEENNQNRLEIIRKRGFIQCGYTQYHKSFFRKTASWFTGSFYDVVMQVWKELDVEIRFTEQSGYGVINERINNGATDIFCAPVRPTKSRRLELFFTKSLAESTVYGYVKNSSPFSTMSFSELQQEKSLRIVVKENDIHHDIVKEYFPHARIVWLPQLAEIWSEILYVANDQADIAFWDDMLTQDLCNQHTIDYGIFTKITKNDQPVKIYENCIALPWWEFDLKEIFDKYI